MQRLFLDLTQEADSVEALLQENNRNELERLDRERHDDFLSMLKGFIINQVYFFVNDVKYICPFVFSSCIWHNFFGSTSHSSLYIMSNLLSHCIYRIKQVGYSEKIASVWATVADETRGYARESD